MHQLSEKYKNDQQNYEDFRIKIESLIKDLLIQNNTPYHKIESRIKDGIKLEEKIIRKNDKYEQLEDITDLIGIRIITFFEDDVDKIAKIISSEFEIDNENSIDKRKSELDRFGYKSLHYVASLKNERQTLTEYKRFGVKKFEVQIRSILQHAWAEIEHDLGYKTTLSIPDELKRDFYRVAALLETADIAFLDIKRKLKHYESSISKKIIQHPENVEINAASLRYYIETSTLINTINTDLKEIIIVTDPTPQFGIESYVDKLHFANIKSIQQLNDFLHKYKNQIIQFAKGWHTRPQKVIVFKGVAINYLVYILVGKTKDLDLTKRYYIEHYKNTTVSEKKLDLVAKKIISLANSY